MGNIEQELMIIPTYMKDDVSEASYVQLFIDIINIVHCQMHYRETWC